MINFLLGLFVGLGSGGTKRDCGSRSESPETSSRDILIIALCLVVFFGGMEVKNLYERQAKLATIERAKDKVIDSGVRAGDFIRKAVPGTIDAAADASGYSQDLYRDAKSRFKRRLKGD